MPKSTDPDYTDFAVESRGLLGYGEVVATARAVAARYPGWRLVVHMAEEVGPQFGFEEPPETIWHHCQPAELHAPDDAVRTYFEVNAVYWQLYPGRAPDARDLFERVLPALDVLMERGFRLWDETLIDLRAKYAEFYNRWSGSGGPGAGAAPAAVE